MFCQTCGTQLGESAQFCLGCGASATPAESRPGPSPAELFSTAVREALAVFRAFASDPVGGLGRSAATLGRERQREIALVFGIFFDVAVVLAAYKVRHMFGTPSFGDVAGMFLLGLVPILSLAGAAALARKVCRGSGSFDGDLVIASGALLPLAFVCLLGALLGAGNIEVLIVAGFFAACYAILILYGGCLHIGGIPEPAAAPAVPIMLLVTAWLTKIIYAALL
jgi:hypothetical protein